MVIRRHHCIGGSVTLVWWILWRSKKLMATLIALVHIFSFLSVCPLCLRPFRPADQLTNSLCLDNCSNMHCPVRSVAVAGVDRRTEGVTADDHSHMCQSSYSTDTKSLHILSPCFFVSSPDSDCRYALLRWGYYGYCG